MFGRASAIADAGTFRLRRNRCNVLPVDCGVSGRFNNAVGRQVVGSKVVIQVPLNCLIYQWVAAQTSDSDHTHVKFPAKGAPSARGVPVQRVRKTRGILRRQPFGSATRTRVLRRVPPHGGAYVGMFAAAQRAIRGGGSFTALRGGRPVTPADPGQTNLGRVGTGNRTNRDRRGRPPWPAYQMIVPVFSLGCYLDRLRTARECATGIGVWSMRKSMVT